MTSKTQLLNTLESLVNQRVTVPTNPYGGQCVALIDNVLQYQGLFNLNFSYLNAIDALSRAESLGLKVTYFNGANNPPVGSVWVTNCLPYHQFGHIGFVVAENPDGTVTTVEQNIDGNGDALYNGGWTRKVTRNLDSAGNFSYIDWNAPTQQMVGWFELPFDDVEVEEVDGMNKGDYFIDVSAYQSADLTGICQASGTRNTIIKVSEGVGWLSPVVAQQTNTSNCIGYYHFARFGGDVGTAQAEANYFISNLPSHPRYLVCDYEDGASGDKQANTNAVLAFMDVCKSNGFEPIYYSYKPYTLANVYVDQITARYPNSLWIAAYPNYDVTPHPVWEIYPNMSHTKWWQFTSTGIAGGLDKNVVIVGDSFKKKKEEEDIMNFVVRSESGKEGWVAVVNGRVFGIGSMGTVDALEATGAKRLQLEDADFERFLYSQSNDAEAVSKAINEASASVVKAIEERAQATQGQTGK
ncbi:MULTISPECIES: GH25 family lysozyme [unclassified Streptococcus]|uniref:GH25 family lysozyme n=1 Tax=unclassified Streptococcus TaxID=2608887 RepID=UPI00191475FA|nr:MULTISPECIES: GH25 family lysozyme [unclassified Streptococcus]MBK5045955.1 CHAP domain-containing protein [Streptococcus sp. 2.1]MBK5161910.1 CHAP domain-containing protein [Streptococcus sp. 3.1]